MARRRISVDKIKEVIRYGVTTELSQRAIGRALKVSRTAVTKYLECFRGSGLTWEQAQELPDSELLAVSGPLGVTVGISAAPRGPSKPAGVLQGTL